MPRTWGHRDPSAIGGFKRTEQQSFEYRVSSLKGERTAPAKEHARQHEGQKIEVVQDVEAIAMAERNSPRLRGAVAATERAVAATRTAGAYTNPTVEVFEGLQYARPISIPGIPGLLQHYSSRQTTRSSSSPKHSQTPASSATLTVVCRISWAASVPSLDRAKIRGG